MGAWGSYRLIHWPRFADFLVAVQGELDKVNWATWDYLFRATGVVLVTMVIAAGFLWVCDFVWVYLFEFIGFLRVQATSSPEKEKTRRSLATSRHIPQNICPSNEH